MLLPNGRLFLSSINNKGNMSVPSPAQPQASTNPPTEFWRHLPQRSDGELFEMLAHQDAYLPESLAAVREELRKRNLPAERATQLEAATQSLINEEHAKSGARLGWPMRIVIFFTCTQVHLMFALILGALLAVRYDSKGFKRRASDCWAATAIGSAVQFVVMVLLHGSKGFPL